MLRPWLAPITLMRPSERGRSSGVERNLAKVEVVSSNLIARSSIFNGCFYLRRCRLWVALTLLVNLKKGGLVNAPIPDNSILL